MKCNRKKSCPCNKNHECDGKCGERMKKKTKAQKKISKVMREYKEKDLTIGKSKKKVKSKKQAIAIALSEAGVSKKRK